VTTFWNETLLPALAAVRQFIQDKVLPIFGNVADWLGAKIPEAIAIAKSFWEEKLQPALATVWKFIDDKILPIFSKVWSWLQISIPAAIATARTFWEEKLQPALAVVWDYIDKNILPVFGKVADWLEANIPKAIAAVKKVIDEQLVPAFRDIKKVLSKETNPELETLAGKLASMGKQMTELQVGEISEMITKLGELGTAIYELSEIVNDIIDYVFDLRIAVGETESEGLLGIIGKWIDILRDLFDPFDDINAALQSAIDMVNLLKTAATDLYEWLGGHTFKFKVNFPAIPDNLTPGSPTPFEMGLRGIASAMRDLNAIPAPALVAPMPAAAGGMAMASGMSVSHTYNLTAQYGYQSERTRLLSMLAGG
jgi:hypothetical protein